MIKVYDRSRKRVEDRDRVKSVSIDFRMRYLKGSRASYLKKGEVIRQNGQVSLNTTNSRTDIVTAFLGVAVEFLEAV